MSFEAAVYWLVSGPLLPSRYMFLKITHFIIFTLLFVKWFEYWTLWNVGVVISVLDDKIGFKAFRVSADLSKGNRLRGASLMLVYIVFRMIVLLVAYNPRNMLSRGFAYKVLETCSFCLGTIITWVVYVVYYYDCKNRYRAKMIQQGRRLELVAANVP